MAYERDDRGYRRDDRYGGPDDRGFFERASDEVRSWFGDEEAERRRRRDERYDERGDVYRDGDRYGRSSRDYGPDEAQSRSYAARDDRRDEERGRFAEREVGGYRTPDRYPSWARSNQDEGRGYARGYAATSQHYQDLGSGESRQFADQPLRSAMGYRSAGDSGMPYAEAADRRRREEEYRSYYRDRESGRERDQSRDDPHGYHSWRSRQIDQFDRDYDEYRRENQARFEQEFAAWRENRQRQRDSLHQVREHQEVIGSDGEHVGTVDHVRGDRILLTKSDRDAGGHHHSIPSNWIERVEDKVHIRRTAAEAKRAWRDEEENQGLFERGNAGTSRTYASGSTAGAAGGTTTTTGSLARDNGVGATAETQAGGTRTGGEGDRNLDRSFSGTY